MEHDKKLKKIFILELTIILGIISILLSKEVWVIILCIFNIIISVNLLIKELINLNIFKRRNLE